MMSLWRNSVNLQQESHACMSRKLEDVDQGCFAGVDQTIGRAYGKKQ